MVQSVLKNIKEEAPLSNIKISWAEIESLSIKLADIIAKDFPYTKELVAISRGGLVPASIIAYQLGIEYVDTICVKTYEKSIRLGRSRLIKGLVYNPYGGKHTVVIDDIVDSGSTLNFVRKILPNAIFVTLFSKLPGEPNLTIHRVATDQWVDFPYGE